MVEHVATILGGLPVIADVAFGRDADGPWGYGEYWSEVQHLYWIKKDGTKGKEIPQHLWDRAEKYDPGFCALTQQVSEDLVAEASHENGPPGVFTFT